MEPDRPETMMEAMACKRQAAANAKAKARAELFLNSVLVVGLLAVVGWVGEYFPGGTVSVLLALLWLEFKSE
jgi:hypothetical protein